MFENNHIFEGEILENNKVVASGPLAIVTIGGGISLRQHTSGMFRGEELVVLSLNPRVFFELDINTGHEVSIAGTYSGTYQKGPLGQRAQTRCCVRAISVAPG